MPGYKDVAKGELYDNPGPNKGKLIRGNITGRVGDHTNSGRPPDSVRIKCRDSFWDRIHRAEEIIDNPASKPSDVLNGLDLLGKYGGLARIDVTTNDEAVKILFIPEDAI